MGVPRTASKQEIGLAYRHKALQYHPDRNTNPGAAERFKQINEIYQTLTNAKRRAEYDRGLHNPSRGYVQSQQATDETSERGGHEDWKPHTSSGRVEKDVQESSSNFGWDILYFTFVAKGRGSGPVHPSRRADMLRLALMIESDGRKLAGYCMLNRETAIQEFSNYVDDPSTAEEFVRQILELLRQDRHLCESVCVEYLSAGGDSEVFKRLLVIELELDEFEAENVVAAAASTMEEDAKFRAPCISIALVLVVGVVTGLVIYFASN